MKQCTGEGLGYCKRCDDNGIWNRTWMCFLYKVEGHDGCYCMECAKELEKEKGLHSEGNRIFSKNTG